MEKQRGVKIIAIVALAVAVLGITIAFAAMSQTLTINGTATMDTAKWDIHFENLQEVVTTGSATVITEPTLSDTTFGNFAISLTKPGDSVKYTFDVVNNGTIDAYLGTFTKLNPQCTSPTSVTSDATIVCNNLEYTLKYSNGTDVAKTYSLRKGQRETLDLYIAYKSSTTTLPSAKVNISNLGITMVFDQYS